MAEAKEKVHEVPKRATARYAALAPGFDLVVIDVANRGSQPLMAAEALPAVGRCSQVLVLYDLVDALPGAPKPKRNRKQLI